MTYKELKDFLETLSPKQLEQKVIVFKEGEEQGFEIDNREISDEDFFWMDGDCYGDKKTTEEQIVEINTRPILDDEPYTIDDFICVPKGTVSLWYN